MNANALHSENNEIVPYSLIRKRKNMHNLSICVHARVRVTLCGPGSQSGLLRLLGLHHTLQPRCLHPTTSVASNQKNIHNLSICAHARVRVTLRGFGS